MSDSFSTTKEEWNFGDERFLDLVTADGLTITEAKVYLMIENAKGKVVTHINIAVAHGRYISPSMSEAGDYSRPLIAKIRRKIGSDTITTVRGIGYYFSGGRL